MQAFGVSLAIFTNISPKSNAASVIASLIFLPELYSNFCFFLHSVLPSSLFGARMTKNP